MRLAEIIDSLRPDGAGFVAEGPESWTQGRTLFGGLQAALLARVMRASLDEALPLRSLQIAFVGPVMAGPVHLQATPLRQGKSATQVEGRILDADGSTRCLAVGVFGRARPSQLRIDLTQPPATRPPEASQLIPRIPGLSPAFTQYLEQRWSHGTLPFCSGSEPRTQVHLRFIDETRTDESTVIALADAIPSPGLSVLKRPAPASSMTWTLELLQDRLDDFQAGYWRMDAEATCAADGYIFQTATLWSPEGRPVALSRQSAVVFG